MTHLRILNKFIGQNFDRNSLKRSHNVHGQSNKILHSVQFYEEETFQFRIKFHNEIIHEKGTKNSVCFVCIIECKGHTHTVMFF